MILIGFVSWAFPGSQVTAANPQVKSPEHGAEPSLYPDVDSFGLPAKRLESLLRKHDANQARLLLARTPRHANDQNERTLWKAACLCNQYKYDEAIEEFKKVEHVEKARGYVLYLAAMAYAQDQDFKKAMELSDLAIKRDNCHECYELRATCHNAAKHYVEAAADYERAAAFSKNHASGFFCEAAGALLKANQPADALALISRAPAPAKGTLDEPVLLVKGTCLERLKHYPEAIEVLSKAIGPKPNLKAANQTSFWLVSCLKERAKCYVQLGRVAEARADQTTLSKMTSGWSDDLIGK